MLCTVTRFTPIHKDALYADYIYNVPESEWPVYFSKMIEYALA